MRLGRWEGKVGEMERVEGSGCSDARRYSREFRVFHFYARTVT